MTPAEAVAYVVKEALLEQGVLEEIEDGVGYGQYETSLYAVTPDGRPVTITIETAPNN